MESSRSVNFLHDRRKREAMRKSNKQVEKVNEKVQTIKKDNSALRLKNSELKDAVLKANTDKNSAMVQLVRFYFAN